MANYIIIGGDGKEYGPVSEADVRQWIAEGRLSAESRVKAESDAEFRALAQFPEFATALNPAVPPAVITPQGGGSGPADANWEANVLARVPDLRLGECLAAGWSFLGANAGFVAGAVLLAWASTLPFVGVMLVVPILGPLIYVCFQSVIMGGLYLACLQRLRGEAVSPTAVFSGFTVAFAQLALTGIVSGLLTEISACCLLLPAIYLMVAWFFSVPLVADKKMFFWTAMELSRKVVTRVWFEVFGLLLVAFLPMLLGALVNFYLTGRFFMGLWDESGHNVQQFAQAMQSQADSVKTLTLKSTLVGQGIYVLNLFYIVGVIVRAYENLFGPRKS